MTISNEENSFHHNNNLDSLPTSPEEDRSGTPTSTASTSATSVGDDEFKKEQNIASASTSASSSQQQSAQQNAQQQQQQKRKIKKEKPKTINFANGISTSVPLTGERPMPNDSSPGMDDEVLLAIFIILFEHDSNCQGMTVKQICDILIKRHPEMSEISTKTSNLVSAKLNAYVKKVEKGDKTIFYSLSRDWADSSPKRMVYVYRGVLSPEYPDYVRKVIEKQRMEESSISASNSPITDDRISSNNAGSSPLGGQIRQKSPFGDSLDFRIPQLSVPYSAAPVTASLNRSESDFTTVKSNQFLTVVHDSDSDVDDDDDDDDDDNNSLKSGFDDDDDDDDDNIDDGYDDEGIYKNHGYVRRGSEIVTDRIPSGIGKRSKSMSFINKRPKAHLTAAAATPRIPRKKSTPNAAAAVAALRAAALNTFNISMNDSVNSITTSIMSDASVEPSISVRWLETVRSGFFNQEMESPEDVSLAELDTLFT
ncbi:Gds1 protein [Martiniozyma asiatica (nom. inval.)]|nr:Gds1 protein [Martiniozyma asiatica]